jgi:ribose/xylose/arabinose/galactoside ABC-type transport system permease subunit
MVLLNVPDFWQQIVVGCIILAAMVRRPDHQGGQAPGSMR